jgi:hypothetical protein
MGWGALFFSMVGFLMTTGFLSSDSDLSEGWVICLEHLLSRESVFICWDRVLTVFVMMVESRVVAFGVVYWWFVDSGKVGIIYVDTYLSPLFIGEYAASRCWLFSPSFFGGDSF